MEHSKYSSSIPLDWKQLSSWEIVPKPSYTYGSPHSTIHRPTWGQFLIGSNKNKLYKLKLGLFCMQSCGIADALVTSFAQIRTGQKEREVGGGSRGQMSVSVRSPSSLIRVLCQTDVGHFFSSSSLYSTFVRKLNFHNTGFWGLKGWDQDLEEMMHYEICIHARRGWLLNKNVELARP